MIGYRRSLAVFLGDANSPIVQIEVTVPQEVFEDFEVVVMVGQILIVLGGYLSNFLQIPPRAGWKIMVFEVVAQIQIGDIPPPNVVICLLPLYKLVVFSYNVYGCRMGSYRTGSRDEGENKCITTPIVVDKVVSDDDEDVVEDLVDSN